ncbi:hypothetical protein AB0O76_33330 [Streptomyces sp. NPDC086554]|uniref:hypothetical protein n=1 Tax=Streptomyces sp. NPDC086554 TaxID=3154864 RepID=UPI0034132912
MATTRRTAKGRQLLLLAALLLGIVTMHTLGHPTGHGSGAEQASARHEMSAGAPAAGPAAGRHGAASADTASGATASGAAASAGMSGTAPDHRHAAKAAGGAPAAQDAHHARVPMPPPPPRTSGDDVLAGPATAAASAPAGLHGMDPLSVCLAVLGAFTLALLLKAGLLRPGGFAVPARALARLLDGLRPNPPPPRILLASLSVLRI